MNKICKVFYKFTRKKIMTPDAQAKIKKLRKPFVNKDCIGCGACAAISSAVFEMNDEMVSTVRQLPDYEGMGVDDAIAGCPVNAISWVDSAPEEKKIEVKK